MTKQELDLLQARIAAVRDTVSDDLMRQVFWYLGEIAAALPVEEKPAGFTAEK